MKKMTSLFTAIVLMMFAAMYAVAGDTNPGKVQESEGLKYAIYKVSNSNKVRLNYEKMDDRKLVVKIFDETGKLVFVESLKENAAKRNYDLSDLSSKKYRFEITFGEYVAQQSVSLMPSETPFYAYLSPEMVNNKVRVSYQHASSPVLVAVKDLKGNVLFSKMVNSDNFSSLLNLSELQSGEYRVMVTASDKTYEHVYEINK